MLLSQEPPRFTPSAWQSLRVPYTNLPVKTNTCCDHEMVGCHSGSLLITAAAESRNDPIHRENRRAQTQEFRGFFGFLGFFVGSLGFFGTLVARGVWGHPAISLVTTIQNHPFSRTNWASGLKK